MSAASNADKSVLIQTVRGSFESEILTALIRNLLSVLNTYIKLDLVLPLGSLMSVVLTRLCYTQEYVRNDGKLQTD